MANKCYWSILTVAGLMADILASSDRTYCYTLVYVKHTTYKLALTTDFFFPLHITNTLRVHCYKEKGIALPLTEWASKIEHCQRKLPENMVKLCLWLG